MRWPRRLRRRHRRLNLPASPSSIAEAPPCPSSSPPSCLRVCFSPLARWRAAGWIKPPVASIPGLGPRTRPERGAILSRRTRRSPGSPRSRQWEIDRSTSAAFRSTCRYHPNAFASLAEAFDPVANARYAAFFLNQLHDRSGSWPEAIALYHSANPFEGQRYSRQVIEAWDAGGKQIGTPLAAAPRLADLVVVRLSTMASAVRVVVPGWADGRPVSSTTGQPAGLPRVVTPSR